MLDINISGVNSNITAPEKICHIDGSIESIIQQELSEVIKILELDNNPTNLKSLLYNKLGIDIKDFIIKLLINDNLLSLDSHPYSKKLLDFYMISFSKYFHSFSLVMNELSIEDLRILLNNLHMYFGKHIPSKLQSELLNIINDKQKQIIQ